MAIDPDFTRYLEVRMTEIRSEIEELIEMHSRFSDTLQKDYLCRARRALTDGLSWFDHFRRHPGRKSDV